MEIVPYIGLGLLIILLPLAIFFGILLLIWKKFKYGKYATLVITVSLIFIVVTAIWPMDSFYVDEFENNSGVSIEVGEVLHKESSYPDMHGDYYSLAVFRVESIDLKKIEDDSSITELNDCATPRSVELFGIVTGGNVRCWSANRNTDEWFSFYYYENRSILYYRFDQT